VAAFFLGFDVNGRLAYTKPALTTEAQAELLLRRGLVADRSILIERLSHVNYYRLSAYWYPFKLQDDNFKEGTSFEQIWRRYTFDRQIRLLLMDVIERIEVSVRTIMVNVFALKFGAFGHLEAANFSSERTGENNDRHTKFLEKLREEAKRSQDEFIRHSRMTYCKWPDLPLWKAAEIMSFGNMFTMFRMLEHNLKKEISSRYDLPAVVFESWLDSLNYIRNVCAHHGRLWNRILAIKPKIPNRKNRPDFHHPISLENNRIFSLLTASKYMLDIIAHQSKWKNRLICLLEEYPDIPINEMGFPERWEQIPIWIV